MKEEPTDLTQMDEGIDRATLNFALHRRAEIKATQDQLEMEVKALNAEVIKTLKRINLKIVTCEVGSYTLSHTKRSSFNKDTMKKELLKKGVPANTVRECLDAATSYSEYDSATFRPPEEKSEAT